MPQPHVNWCAEISVEIAREVYKTCWGFGDFVVGMFTLHNEDGTCQPQNEMYVLSSNPKCFRIQNETRFWRWISAQKNDYGCLNWDLKKKTSQLVKCINLLSFPPSPSQPNLCSFLPDQSRKVTSEKGPVSTDDFPTKPGAIPQATEKILRDHERPPSTISTSSSVFLVGGFEPTNFEKYARSSKMDHFPRGVGWRIFSFFWVAHPPIVLFLGRNFRNFPKFLHTFGTFFWFLKLTSGVPRPEESCCTSCGMPSSHSVKSPSGVFHGATSWCVPWIFLMLCN